MAQISHVMWWMVFASNTLSMIQWAISLFYWNIVHPANPVFTRLVGIEAGHFINTNGRLRKRITSGASRAVNTRVILNKPGIENSSYHSYFKTAVWKSCLCGYKSMMYNWKWVKIGSGNGSNKRHAVTWSNCHPDLWFHTAPQWAKIFNFCRIDVDQYPAFWDIYWIKTIREIVFDVCMHLTHLPLVPHICVSESGKHWFR